MATRSSILAWKIPWTEEPGGLQSRGSQTDRDDLSDLACITEGIIGKWTPDFGSEGLAQKFYREPLLHLINVIALYHVFLPVEKQNSCTQILINYFPGTLPGLIL